MLKFAILALVPATATASTDACVNGRCLAPVDEIVPDVQLLQMQLDTVLPHVATSLQIESSLKTHLPHPAQQQDSAFKQDAALREPSRNSTQMLQDSAFRHDAALREPRHNSTQMLQDSAFRPDAALREPHHNSTQMLQDAMLKQHSTEATLLLQDTALKEGHNTTFPLQPVLAAGYHNRTTLLQPQLSIKLSKKQLPPTGRTAWSSFMSMWSLFRSQYPVSSAALLVIMPTAAHLSIRLVRRRPTAETLSGASELLKEAGGKASRLRLIDRARIFWVFWDSLALLFFLSGILNVKWDTTPSKGVAFFVIVIEGMLHWFVLETPLLALLTFFVRPSKVLRAPAPKDATVVLNYNLLATCEDDVDECMDHMLQAFLGNLSKGVAAVLVSATNDPKLREYELRKRDECRARIRSEAPPALAETLAHDFLVLHRVSRVLRKCGQYQDLMLLAANNATAFTYCSQELHGAAARTLGEPLFQPGPDAERVRGRHFTFTMVLDSDTVVRPGVVAELLRVATANPAADIIQPAIRLNIESNQESVFAHLEALRQRLFSRMTEVQMSFFAKSPFFGKGLIRTHSYLSRCIGEPGSPLDVVPIDVLSHDTFEAAVTTTLFVPDVVLEEAPCSNYASWSEREMRWNRGELILATYFWPIFGTIVRKLQRLFYRREVPHTARAHMDKTLAKMDAVSRYFAHAALRTMCMKLVLLVYLISSAFVDLWFRKIPLCTVMFMIIVLPKIAVASDDNLRASMLETIASLLQFTPEAIIGSTRVLRALQGLVTGMVTWTPQRRTEADFKSSNPWAHAVRYLGAHIMAVVVLTAALWRVFPGAVSPLLLMNVGCVVFLPLYVGATSHKRSSWPQSIATILRGK